MALQFTIAHAAPAIATRDLIFLPFSFATSWYWAGRRPAPFAIVVLCSGSEVILLVTLHECICSSITDLSDHADLRKCPPTWGWTTSRRRRLVPRERSRLLPLPDSTMQLSLNTCCQSASTSSPWSFTKSCLKVRGVRRKSSISGFGRGLVGAWLGYLSGGGWPVARPSITPNDNVPPPPRLDRQETTASTTSPL